MNNFMLSFEDIGIRKINVHYYSSILKLFIRAKDMILNSSSTRCEVECVLFGSSQPLPCREKVVWG